MKNNIIHHASGCPKNQDEVRKVELQLNYDISEEDADFWNMRWSFDSGLKLYYDGPILTISSSFYPPSHYYGNTWDGTVSIYLLGERIHRKEFDYPTLDKLKSKVEEYVKFITDNLKDLLKKELILK